MTTNVCFTSHEGKRVIAKVNLDKDGVYTCCKISINENDYNIKGECRRNKVLDIIQKYVDLEYVFYSLTNNID